MRVVNIDCLNIADCNTQGTESMAKHDGYTPAALAIARRMSELDLTQGDVAKAIDRSQSWVSQSLLGNSERTLRRLIVNQSKELDVLLRALQWTLPDLLRRTQLDLPVTSGEDGHQDPLSRWQVAANFVVFPVYHSASAGTGTGNPIDDAEAPIPRAHLTARGVHEAETMVVLINGDCMVSNDARSQESIKHHDYVAIHMGAPAATGKIGVFWDEQSDQLIIKGIGEGTDDHIILYPANGGPPIVRPREDPDLIYRGLVFWRGGNVN